MSARGRDSPAEDGDAVTFRRHDDEEERVGGRVSLPANCHVPRERDHDAVEEEEEEREAPAGGRERSLCPPAPCFSTSREARAQGDGDWPPRWLPRCLQRCLRRCPRRCPCLGLFYAFLSTFLFSSIGAMAKYIQEIDAVEISAIRCFFQMVLITPLLIYHKTGFLGPRDKRIYLTLRGFFGSSAMILLFYAFQQMPLADANVIMFSNPVFTACLARIFLKEKCTIWDSVFTVFTLAGVVLIARPKIFFGKSLDEVDSSSHMKGAGAALTAAIAAATTLVILRKLGKSVHYCLSVWYYAVIGLIQCVIIMSVLGRWKPPECGRDRYLLVLIAVFGIAAQSLLVKALQLEKAGPVSLMRAGDVLLSFIFQYFLFHEKPTWWTAGGAACIVLSTMGAIIRKWCVTRGS